STAPSWAAVGRELWLVPEANAKSVLFGIFCRCIKTPNRIFPLFPNICRCLASFARTRSLRFLPSNHTQYDDARKAAQQECSTIRALLVSFLILMPGPPQYPRKGNGNNLSPVLANSEYIVVAYATQKGGPCRR